MITIRKQKEMKKYYVKKVNTYVFEDDVEFLCDVDVEANIAAHNIKARNIVAYDIRAWNIISNNIKAFLNISAQNINANNIDYFSVCFAYKNIECNSIKGRYKNSKHFVFDGKLIIKGDEY